MQSTNREVSDIFADNSNSIEYEQKARQRC